jgi:hypothetical protein
VSQRDAMTRTGRRAGKNVAQKHIGIASIVNQRETKSDTEQQRRQH